MCWKLVRDGLAEELRARGVIVWRARDRGEYERALRAKIVEEAFELAAARSPSDILEEAADILEALGALLRLYGYSIEDAAARARVKREARGGFDGGYIALYECGSRVE